MIEDLIRRFSYFACSLSRVIQPISKRYIKVYSRVRDNIPRIEIGALEKLDLAPMFNPINAVSLVVLLFYLLSFRSMSPISRAIFSLGYVSLISGIYLGGRYIERRKFSESSIFLDKNFFKGIGILLYSVGALFCVLVTISQGVPILGKIFGLPPELVIPAFLVVPGAIFLSYSARKEYFYALFILGFVFLFGIGYRTPVVALIIGGLVLGYKRVFSTTVAILSSLALISYVVLYGWFKAVIVGWRGFSPLSLALERMKFTSHVFDYIVSISYPWGLTRGDLLLSIFPGPGIGPRTMISNVFGGRPEATITSTIFGPPMLDFGVLGVVVFSFLIGFSLSISLKCKPLYALLLGYLLPGIETGIVDFLIITYFLLPLLIAFSLEKTSYSLPRNNNHVSFNRNS